MNYELLKTMKLRYHHSIESLNGGLAGVSTWSGMARVWVPLSSIAWMPIQE